MTVPVRVSEHDLLGLLPAASLEVVTGAGHMPQEEQPARVSQLMLDWLTSSLTPRPRPATAASPR